MQKSEGVKLKVTGSVGPCWRLLKPGYSHGELACRVLLATQEVAVCGHIHGFSQGALMSKVGESESPVLGFSSYFPQSVNHPS